MNILIVEDEVMAQKSLGRVLLQNFPDFDIVGYTDSVKGTVAWLNEPGNKADIIFMDVELSDGVCFEIFRQTEVKAKVIMTTAYDSYALKAFEAGSIDYLLKPINPEALKRAVSRCRASSGGIDVEALIKAAGGGAGVKKEYKERFLIRVNDRIIPLETAAETSARLSDSTFLSAEEPPSAVILILSPGAPSGTGNTLSSFTSSEFALRFAAPAHTISENSAPFNVCISKLFTSLIILSIPPLVRNYILELVQQVHLEK